MAPSRNILVHGAAGRMGRAVTAELRARADAELCAAVDREAGPGVSGPGELARLLSCADAAVDFSLPEASLFLLEACARSGKPAVVGTTGFSADQMERIGAAAKHIPVFLSPNMSPAVNLTFAVAALLAAKLPGFDAHVHEAHHKAKKDAPSGTALRYAERLRAAGREPGVTSVRAGDIVGEHTVLFAGPHERVELTHRAHSRAVFARGAVDAALWLAGRPAGLYDFSDLLGLRGLEAQF